MTVLPPPAPGTTPALSAPGRATGLVVPVVLSGGSGTRLWPVSRESFPKQFWPLASDRPMIAETALRATGDGFAPPIVVCNQEHRFVVAEQLHRVGITTPTILLEPVGRNSAPAIAAAALIVAEQDPDAVLWMMAADAAMGDLPALHRAVDAAVAAARAGRIVTFGMRPTAPETGYGYIEVGTQLPGLPGVHDLARFVEKPDAAQAETLVASGRHLWNSGMFVFTARTLLEEMERHAPDVLAALRPAVTGRTQDLDFCRLDPVAFAAVPNISLDYAVAEKTDRAAVVPADLGWSDVGSWGALWELGNKDTAGNVAVGDDVLLEGATDCYVRSDGILTAVLGLKDAVVVVTEDAVLAMDRSQAQNVKRVVDRLKAGGKRQAVSHNRVYRPWGFYESLIQGQRFQVKRILVNPGHQLSLQKHFHRAEHWVVVSGTAEVTCDDTQKMVRENESIYLPLGSVHRLQNPGRIPLTLIEVQVGSYLGEDDIVRFEDTYGRR
ncbi:mannose-1-phosphate guanylyltransferase [Rhodovastum atsumiense]|uniref:mannose-1-phosphate guanylyltransferase n=1 Tax=Rhodovastum atsumiense TaxID=504468 RepID=A0A5M6IS61_9PROT|nr:mannose-1-phosphate guanylyltransferase/mannose-6-phosphate isomerase [Rhodovastum atsumiense]KAA5610749.1 mannose-1-phosphate guanylyltransferase/mannose-6-phosphate isomerase [Rhodovastum atsumiense]CAH2604391.1 mannose-1-phosphate guanylyltransferase [Rhodovastum atsumiense]